MLVVLSSFPIYDQLVMVCYHWLCAGSSVFTDMHAFLITDKPKCLPGINFLKILSGETTVQPAGMEL